MSRIFDNVQLPSLKSMNQYHQLSYQWCFWQHMRLQPIPKKETDETENNKESIEGSNSNITDNNEYDENQSENNNNNNGNNIKKKINLRDTQYIQDTTILKFPKIYSNNLEHTENIDSVEQFWESFSNMKNLNDVAIDTEYFFFKKGIKPLWEDEINKNGGRWSFILGNNHLNPTRKLFISIFWELLLIKLISGQFIKDNISIPLSKEVLDNPEFDDVEVKTTMTNHELNKLIMDDIAGLVISVRNKKVIISIWNTHISFENYKKENNVAEHVKSEKYNHSYKEKLDSKNKAIFEKIGLTTFQFRKLISDSIVETLHEAINIIEEKEGIKEKSELLKHTHQYSPHFIEGHVDSKRIKFNDNNNNNNKMKKHTDWHNNKSKSINGNDNERFGGLGKIRKKIEFTEEGLMVEELNVLSLRQKWNRNRRPSSKSKNEDYEGKYDYLLY
jgi:hypothetical protein